MEAEMTRQKDSSLNEPMIDLLNAIQSECSIELSDVDIYHENCETMEDTFLQSIDETAIEVQLQEAQSNDDVKPASKSRALVPGYENSSVHWTHQTTFQLVKTVEKYPELWDNQYIYSIYSRNARWETVADILNTTVDEFKENPLNSQDVIWKWRRLRQQKWKIENDKRHHRKKRRERIPKEFSYYNYMDFLFNPPSKQAQKEGVPFPTEKLSQYRDSRVRWNYQTTVAVISEVKKHPVIWATSKGHPPSSARTKAYSTVLDNLNSSVPAFIKDPISMNDLRLKWKNLRCYQAKCHRNSGSSSGREWEFFHAMEFLDSNNSLQQEDFLQDSSPVHADSNECSMEAQYAVTADSSAVATNVNFDGLQAQADVSSTESRDVGDDNASADMIEMDEDREENERFQSSKRWNYETTMTIINEIKKYPVIWNFSNNCHLIDERFGAFDSIVLHLNTFVPAFINNPITMKELSWKWTSLRCYKKRCLRNLKKNTSLKEWEYFSALEFIEEKSSQEPLPKGDSSLVPKSKVKWNHVTTMALINEVKKYPDLWSEDVRSRHNASYNYEVYTANKNVITQLNASVPAFIKSPLTIKDMRMKWKYLRQYMRKLMKTEFSSDREWEFYSAMSFLKAEYSPQQPDSSIHDSLDAPNNRLEAMTRTEAFNEQDPATEVLEKLTGDNEATEDHLQKDNLQKSEVKWNRQSTIALINEMKKYPELWNQGIKSRHHSSYKYDLYLANKNVVATLNATMPSFKANPITIDDMRSKWKHLRQYMRRCLNSKFPNGKEWEFYSALCFLKSHYNLRQQDLSAQASHLLSSNNLGASAQKTWYNDSNNQYEPVVQVKCEPDYVVEEQTEDQLQNIGELITSSSSPTNKGRVPEETTFLSNKRPRREAAVDSPSAAQSPIIGTNSLHLLAASTGYGDVSSSSTSSSSLCTIALLQMKHAFSMERSSGKQINFYQSISQLCAQFIGGSNRFNSDDDAAL